mmetsp:Transcript_15112/g.23360  ORF Transcript_15112/g.23360 Transcript_15112/m.23360 type:complete len:118 (-) Transcript_15112:955-1308(-)
MTMLENGGKLTKKTTPAVSKSDIVDPSKMARQSNPKTSLGAIANHNQSLGSSKQYLKQEISRQNIGVLNQSLNSSSKISLVGGMNNGQNLASDPMTMLRQQQNVDPRGAPKNQGPNN